MDIGVINALRDAGVAIGVSIIMAAIFIAATNLVKIIVTSNNSAQDKRWDDMIKQNDARMKIQSDQLERLHSIDNTMEDGMDEIRKRFDLLEESVRHVHSDIEAIKIALFNETQAGG